MNRCIACFVVASAWLVGTSLSAQAVPILQLYIEGADYDRGTDTWVVSPQGSSSGAPFRLWVIGNVSGPGGKGSIMDVRLAASYLAEAGGTDDVRMTLTSSTTPTSGPYGGFTDPSTPGTPIFRHFGTAGTRPRLGPLDRHGNLATGDPGGDPTGRSLPPHGIYGADRVWQEFYLGHFDQTDSPIADFVGEFPTPDHPNSGQINVYEVSVLTRIVHPLKVHFDVYDSVAGSNKGRFAPFSHTADADANIVPEPSTAILLGSGISMMLSVALCLRWSAWRGSEQTMGESLRI